MKEYKKIKALLVEDTELALQAALLAIRQTKCEIDVARTGKEALEKFKINHYDLIFMDLGLPDIEGDKITKAIREIEGERKHTLVFALTAHIKENPSKEAPENLFDDFITKPLTTERVFGLFQKYNL